MKHFVILVFAVFVSLILFGCVGSQKEASPVPPTPGVSQPRQSTAQEQNNDAIGKTLSLGEMDLYTAKAYNEQNKLVCENFTTYKDVCLALADRDFSICMQQTAPYSKDYCIQRFAELTQNETMCNLRSSNAFVCITNIAISKNNILICDILKFGMTQTGWDEKAYCYKEFAIATKNATICASIPDSDVRASCYEMVTQ